MGTEVELSESFISFSFFFFSKSEEFRSFCPSLQACPKLVIPNLYVLWTPLRYYLTHKIVCIFEGEIGILMKAMG